MFIKIMLCYMFRSSFHIYELIIIKSKVHEIYKISHLPISVNELYAYIYVYIIYTPCLRKKLEKFFYQNFVKFPSILITFGR